MTSEQRLTAPEINAKRITESLAFHQDRIEWLSEEQPRWGDGENVEPSFVRILLVQSREAIRLLELGTFIAGGEA